MNIPPPELIRAVPSPLDSCSFRNPHVKPKSFSKGFAFRAVLGALLMSPLSLLAQANLLLNPGLETGDTSGWADSTGSYAAVTGQAHTGTYAGRVAQYGNLRQIVTGLLPNTTYTATGWFKSATAGQAIYLIVDNGGTPTSVSTSSATYTQLSRTFTTGTNTSAKIGAYQSGTGYGYCDDLSLPQVGPSNLVINPGLETGDTSGWNDSTGSYAAVTGQAHTGTYAGRVAQYGNLRQIVTGLLPNTTYTATGWFKSATAGQAIYLIVDNGGTSISVSTGSTAYTQLSRTFTTGTNTSAKIGAYQSGTGYGYCDDLSLTGSSSGTGDATGTQADRIADCLQRFGVNTFSNGQGQGNYDAVTTGSAINYITAGSGLTLNVREYTNRTYGTAQVTWVKAVHASTGSPFTIALAVSTGTADVPAVVNLVRDSGTSGLNYVKWVEGINEPNNAKSPVAVATTDAAQTYLYQQVHAITSTVPVMGPSIVIPLPIPDGTITGYMGTYLSSILSHSDINNIHLYNPKSPNAYDGSSVRHGAMDDVDTGYVTVLPGKPGICTEFQPTLYSSIHGNSPIYDAYWGPIFLLSSYYDFDWQASFWFALFDYDSVSMPVGLFATSYTDPKAAANAYRALFKLTGDTGATKLTFTPEKIDVTVSGLPAAPALSPKAGGRWALFENSSHQYFLMIWNEQNDISATTAPVTVTFNSHNMTKVEEFNITNGSLTATQSPTNVHTMTVNLDTSVRLLRITY